jgi:group I intron endonuclease
MPRPRKPPQVAVYRLLCVPTDQAYVGGTRDLAQRFRYHRKSLRGGYHFNRGLQAAWAAFGESAFVFEVLERLQDDSTLLAREQHYIDALKATESATGFNVCPTAGSVLGMAVTEEARARMSAAGRGKPKSAEHRSKIAAGRRGKRHTEETKQRLREAALAQFASPECRARHAAAINARRLH